MKIAKYVGDLLYDYECVVIPGLGGFITKDSSVSINEVTHNFSPPFRNVYFNIHLRANDGLLVNHVAQQEQIGYKLAKLRVDKFAFQCHNALNAGKKIKFKNIGSIYYDGDNNIVFKQDIKSNFNPNSFGLGNLVSPAIRRITDEQKVKRAVKSAIEIKKPIKKPVDRKGAIANPAKRSSINNMQAKKRKSTFTNQIIFLLVLVLFMGSGYIYMRREAMKYYFDKYASNIPFFYSSINDYLSTNINSSHVAKLSQSTASFFPDFNKNANEILPDNKTNTPNVIDEIINNEPEVTTSVIDDVTFIKNNSITEKSDKEIIVSITPTNNTEPAMHTKETIVSNNRFFLIAGSFSEKSNAKSLVRELKSQGYDALIADTNKYGMYRVAFMSFKNRKLAENKLLAIRNESNPKAWLLTK